MRIKDALSRFYHWSVDAIENYPVVVFWVLVAISASAIVAALV